MAAVLAALAAAPICPAPGHAFEWSGSIGVQSTAYADEPIVEAQPSHRLSLSLDTELFHDWDEGRQRFVFSPFVRWDSSDARRTHVDAREAYWQRDFERAELSIGLRRIFWGVTESVHLVDVINQTDFVENVDGEDKLGQPMARLRWLPAWGTLDLYLMPAFRPRTFPGDAGRPRLALPVNEDAARYESAQGESRAEFALRYSHYVGPWDFGIAHFSGTSRTPRMEFVLDPARGPQLRPYYDLLEQTSIDIQATLGSWLWKLEALARRNDDGHSAAFAAGFEYTLDGLFGAADLGIIAEYMFDDQPAQRTAADDDLALGARLAFNDVQDTRLLLFSVIDLNSRASFTSIEGSRRLGERWRLSVEGRVFAGAEPDELLYSFRQDDYVELGLERYF